jgi:hypothetical protein
MSGYPLLLPLMSSLPVRNILTPKEDLTLFEQ